MKAMVLVVGILLSTVGLMITEIQSIPVGLAKFISLIFIPLGISVAMLSFVLKDKPNN